MGYNGIGPKTACNFMVKEMLISIIFLMFTGHLSQVGTTTCTFKSMTSSTPEGNLLFWVKDIHTMSLTSRAIVGKSIVSSKIKNKLKTYQPIKLQESGIKTLEILNFIADKLRIGAEELSTRWVD